MDVYVASLFIFIILLGTATYWQKSLDIDSRLSLFKPGVTELDVIDDEIHDIEGDSTTNRYYQFLNRFLLVHGIVVAADWLQGSYMYNLYRYTHQLPDHVVASLLAVGFLFSGLAAPLAAPLADRLGRKQACLLYCILSGLSSLMALSRPVSVLVLGRVLAGLGGCMLPTVFDMWMLGEMRRLDLGHSDEAVRHVRRSTTATNALVSAAAVGIASPVLVRLFASEAAPFVASALCLGLAYALISKTWVENYESGTTTRVASRLPSQAGSMAVLAIGISSFALEASSSLVYAFWAPSIISARDSSFTWAKGRIPFGLIFSQFTSATTLGSFVFTYLSSTARPEAGRHQHPSLLVRLSLAACSLCLLVTVATGTETLRFWSLCMFQFSVGLCSSGMSHLKETLLGEHQRINHDQVVPVPLTMLVVAALVTVDDDDVSRGDRWMVCSGFLLLATVLMTLCFPRPKSQGGALPRHMD